MKKIVLFIASMISLVLLTSCNSTEPVGGNSYQWSVIQSPQTGCYYEILSYYRGTNYGLMSMSEITKEEYDRVKEIQK